MLCRLCLTEAADNISIFDEENVYELITKFLNLKLTAEDPISKLICTPCWQNLEAFQKFCCRIEEAQKSLGALAYNLKLEADKEEDDNDAVHSEEDELPFEVVNTDTSSHIMPFKAENTEANLREDTFATTSTFPILDEDLLKVELQEPKFETLDETLVSPQPRRSARGSCRKRNASPECVALSLPILKVRESRGRPVTDEIKNSMLIGQALNTAPNADVVPPKKKRGRPKKGEERPKVAKPPKPKTESKESIAAKMAKIKQTSKELDDVIQKYMKLACNLCGTSLVDFAELKRHFRAVHNRRGFAVCCNKRLYKRSLVVDHINTHNDPEYFKCTECGRVMADRMCLRNHMLVLHQNEEDKIFKCSYCPKKFAKQYMLDHHLTTHIPEEECSFICTECKKGYPTKSTLTQHFSLVHAGIYDKMCEICAKVIRGTTAFERHMQEHQGIFRPQAQCEICGTWLKDKNNLRKHMYMHDGRTYSCNECGKSVPSKSALTSHLKYMHKIERQFGCTYCDKAFKKAVALKEHMATHTGAVLYTCPHCPKTFNSKANMHSHRKKKHYEEWEANRRGNIKPEPNSVSS